MEQESVRQDEFVQEQKVSALFQTDAMELLETSRSPVKVAGFRQCLAPAPPVHEQDARDCRFVHPDGRGAARDDHELER